MNTAVYSIAEVAKLLGVSKAHASHLAKTNRLPVEVTHLGQRLVVSREKLDAYLSGQPASLPSPTTDAATILINARIEALCAELAILAPHRLALVGNVRAASPTPLDITTNRKAA